MSTLLLLTSALQPSAEVLGLDITTSSVKLIELSMSGGQYRVESYAAEATPPNSINEKAIVDASAVGDAARWWMRLLAGQDDPATGTTASTSCPDTR